MKYKCNRKRCRPRTGSLPVSFMGPQGLGESVLQCARLWLLKQATWGAILGPSLLWGGARWFLPQSATFLPHLAPQCLSPKRTWWPVLVYGNFLKDKAANPEADGPAAQALTPAWPRAPAAHIPHLFRNMLSLYKT